MKNLAFYSNFKCRNSYLTHTHIYRYRYFIVLLIIIFILNYYLKNLKAIKNQFYPWHLSRGRAGFRAVFGIGWRGGCRSHGDRVATSWKHKKCCRYIILKEINMTYIFLRAAEILFSYSPEDPFALFKVFGFLFLVWIPSFFMASGRGTCKMWFFFLMKIRNDIFFINNASIFKN